MNKINQGDEDDTIISILALAHLKDTLDIDSFMYELYSQFGDTLPKSIENKIDNFELKSFFRNTLDYEANVIKKTTSSISISINLEENLNVDFNSRADYNKDLWNHKSDEHYRVYKSKDAAEYILK